MKFYDGYNAMRSFVFRDVTQCKLVVSQRRFETSYRSHLPLSSSSKSAWSIWNASPLKMGTTASAETSVSNYQPTPCAVEA